MSAGHPLWLADRPLVLASKSATRIAMLEAAGLPVEAVPAAIDERALEDETRQVGGDAATVAASLARAKALAVSSVMPGRIVVGADQTLDLGGEALHKPSDRAAAIGQLRRMAGRDHVLHSAACIARDGVVVADVAADARLRVRDLSEASLARYCDAAGDAVTASVGAYQLEGPGIHLFSAIDGDHFTILGLPLLPLLAALRHEGWVVP
ncbi:Maf family protein [Alsobacter sp. R-9]